MKKLSVIAVLALAALSSQAFAQVNSSLTLEGQSLQGRDGTLDAKSFDMTARHNLNHALSGHVQASGSQTNRTNAVTTRLEAGLTGVVSLRGPFSGYTTVAVGEAFRSTGNFGFYSIEPGVRAALGAGLTAHVGYRYRAPFDSAVADTTSTTRFGVSYALTKQDSVGVRYDRVMQNAKQDVIGVSYTRRF